MFRLLLWNMVFVFPLIAFHPSAAYAQDESAPTNEETADTSEQNLAELEAGAREIGLAAGYSTQCLRERGDEEAAQAIGDEAIAVAELILQDFGSTIAFLFAANAGYGAGDPVDVDQCDQYISDWSETVDAFFVELETLVEEASE